MLLQPDVRPKIKILYFRGSFFSEKIIDCPALTPIYGIRQVNFFTAICTCDYFYSLVTNDYIAVYSLLSEVIMIQFSDLLVCI